MEIQTISTLVGILRDKSGTLDGLLGTVRALERIGDGSALSKYIPRQIFLTVSMVISLTMLDLRK